MKINEKVSLIDEHAVLCYDNGYTIDNRAQEDAGRGQRLGRS